MKWIHFVLTNKTRLRVAVSSWRITLATIAITSAIAMPQSWPTLGHAFRPCAPYTWCTWNSFAICEFFHYECHLKEVRTCIIDTYLICKTHSFRMFRIALLGAFTCKAWSCIWWWAWTCVTGAYACTCTSISSSTTRTIAYPTGPRCPLSRNAYKQKRKRRGKDEL